MSKALAARPGYVRRIRNVFLVKGDAHDCAAHLDDQGLRPRMYERSVRAELQGVMVYVVVADTKLETGE